MTSRSLCVLGLVSFLLSATAYGKSCEELKELSLPDTSIESETVASGEFKDPAAPWMQPTPLPAHCRVRGAIRPTADSDIKFEVWLPLEEEWNGKLQGSDNGGFAGSINQLGLMRSVQRGYVGVSTDTGHVGAVPEETIWAKGHPEKVVDFAHRAIHLMTVNAKAIAEAFYGEAPKRSYFAGCSNGGRQALMSAQRYPEDYDGIIAGAPAHDWTHLMMSFIWNANALSKPGAFIPATLAPVIQAEVNQQCDARDGVADGVLAAPKRCNFNPEKLLCAADKTESCLQRAQVDALRAIYRGPHTSAGVRLYPGFLPGAEVGHPLPGMGWDGWIFGDARGNSVQARFGKNFMRGIVTGDDAWLLSAFDFDRDPAAIDARYAAILNATDPDLSHFVARGGKLILYHGMADAAIPFGSSIDYFEAVGKEMGATRRDGFVRLFLAPGMQHCFAGPGPSSFGGIGPADQPPDPGANLSAALEAWVEQGKAPGSVIAVKPKNLGLALVDAKQAGVERSGLLCAYPERAKWSGKGDAGDAANYTCTPPEFETVKIWPGAAPGTADWSGPETAQDLQVPDAGRVVHIIKNVTEPTLTIVRPARGEATGAGMIVLPGGAFGALAWDLEGMEVARWLADRGVTAFVLKYRVHEADPAMASRINEIFSKVPVASRFEEAMKVLEPRRQIAVDDGMQAIRVVRSEAHKYGVSADRIGMMGFSAGAITTMGVVMESDAATRPNFAAPIYGAMASNEAPPKDAPPLFIAAAADDKTVPPSKSVAMFQAWQSAGLRAELHVYESGGHGFGLGKPATASSEWTDAFEAWLGAQNLASGQLTRLAH